MNKRVMVPLERIQGNPWQTRAGIDPDYIANELAPDIKKNGLLQVPVGRVMIKAPDDRYAMLPADLFETEILNDASGQNIIQLAFGHNRLAAFRWLSEKFSADWAMMPVDLQEISDEGMALAAWSENNKRKDLTPIEEATAIARDIEAFGWTQKVAADKLGLARETVANKLRLLKLPAEVQKALGEGTISERQASALLPLAEIPEESAAIAEKKQFNWNKPSDVLKRALTGKQSSDEIRREVESAINEASVNLVNCKFIDQAFEGGNYQSAACANCTWRMKNKDRDQCRRPDCYELKVQAWIEISAQEAVRIAGLELLPPKIKDDAYSAFHTYDGDEQTAAAQIYANGCENLRLQKSPYGGFHPNGVEEFAMVCMHGEGKKCTCKARLLRDIHKNDPVKIKAKEDEKAIETMKDSVRAFLAAEMLAGNADVWRGYLINREWETAQIEKIKAMDLPKMANYLIQSLAAHLVLNAQDPEKARANIEAGLAVMGLKAPWKPGMTPAEEAWGKFLRIQGWMKSLIKLLPKVEAVKGNIQNLYDLLGVDGQTDEQREEIGRHIGQLERIVDQVENLNQDQFQDISMLITVPAGDTNFKGSLERGTVAMLKYVLGLLPRENGNEAKIQKIDARLRKITPRTLMEVFDEQ